MATVISRRDLERMRALANSVNGSQPQTASYTDEEKRKLSQAKVEKWPNTLMAIRQKKENFAVEKELERERLNKLMDEEEARLRIKERDEALARAANIIDKRTDNMKLLKSKKLLADTLYTRQLQSAEKKTRAQLEKQEKEEYDEFVIAQVKRGDENEREKLEQRKKQIQLVALTREQQLFEVKSKREREREEVVKLGIQFKEQAKIDYINELKKNENNIQKIKDENENMILLNEKLRIVRDEIRSKEAEAIAAAEKEVDVIEERKNGRKQIEQNRQTIRNKKRQDLIDAATLRLSAFSNRESEILSKQEHDIKDRLEQQDKDKAKKAEDDWQLTIQSRQAQVDAKRLAKEKQRSEELAQIEIFAKTNEYELNKEKTKQRLAREREDNLKIQLRQEATQRKVMQKLEKEKTLAEQREFLDAMKNDNSKFIELCVSEIESYKSQGKPTFPIIDALAYANPKEAAKRQQSNNLALNVPVYN